jgi:TonB-linked SusC/RagA family outer membrane protein
MNFTRDIYAPKASSSKILKVMRILPLLLTVALIQVKAESIAQITLNLKKANLFDAMNEITRQAGVDFTYGASIRAKETQITISITNAPLEIVMSKLLQGTAISWERSEKMNTIVLFIPKNQPSSPAVPADTSIGRTVSGKVYSSTGEVLVGASVRMNDDGEGTVTNNAGEFVLHGVENNDIITVTYTGYTSTSSAVGTRSIFNFFLVRSVKELDKVVIQGYGTTSQRKATGNISTVTAEEISRQPVMNALEAIKGKIPGLTITATSGYKSGTFKMELRGRSQLSTEFPGDPLIILNGVPLTVIEQGDGDYATGSRGWNQNKFPTPAGGQSPLFSINPEDIESISVLKDADATAIYGSRGGRGVILITTKSGKAGTTEFKLDVSSGVSFVGKYPKLLSINQYVEMRKEAFRNNDIEPDAINAFDILVWDITRDKNWAREFWSKSALFTEADASVHGGDKQTTFRISGNFQTSKAVNTYSGSDSRASMSTSINHKSANRKFEFSFTGLYSITNVNNIVMNAPVTMFPNAPDAFDNKGNLNFAGWEPARYLFPYAALLQPYVGKSHFLNASTIITSNPVKGLKLSITGGYSNALMEQDITYPIRSQEPLYSPKGRAVFGSNISRRSIIEPMAEYNNFIGIGKLQILVGASYQVSTQKGSKMSGDGYVNDNLLHSINNAPVKVADDNYGEYKYAASYSRINYDIKDRYIITLNARRDGSSKFGPGKQFGNFWSVGAAYIFSETEFVKTNLPWLSFGKIRGSYGVVGSDLIGDYNHISRWTALNPYLGDNAYMSNRLTNPDLKWQVDKKAEIALNLGLLRDRINIDLIYYRNKSEDQLLPQYSLPLISGFQGIAANFPGVVRNTGIEPALRAKIVQSKNTEFSFNIQMGINRNKLISFPGLEFSAYSETYVIGQPLSIRKLLTYTGVDPQTGKYTYADRFKDGQISASPDIDDRIWKDLTIKYDGGFGFDFRHGGFSANILCHFRKQVGNNLRITAGFPGTQTNQPVEVMKRWQKPGDVTDYARFTTIPDITDAYLPESDKALTDASFIRLSNVSIAYQFNNRLMKLFKLKSLRAQLSGQNLLLISPYKGGDPELQVFGAMPPLTTITAGLIAAF